MTIRTIYVSLLLLFSNFILAQKIEIGGDWSGIDYINLCPTYKFSHDGKLNDPLSILDHNNISQAKPGSQQALAAADYYIKERGGTDFFDSCKFYDLNVAYPENLEELKKVNSSYKAENCIAKYYASYIFSPGGDIQYRFGIALDEKFQIVSGPSFPDIKKRPDFHNMISPEDAYNLALTKQRKLIEDAKAIQLEYDKKRNLFVWEITGKSVEEPNNKKEYTHGFVRLNAVTGKIITSCKVTEYHLVNSRYF